MKKRLFLTALALLVVLSLGCVTSLCASAAEGPTMTLGSATGKAVHEEVTLALTVSDFSESVEEAEIKLRWDPAELRYVGAAVGDVVGNATFLPILSATDDVCWLNYWSVDELLTASTGSIARITFEVLTEGEHTVSVEIKTFSTVTHEYAGDFAVTNGTITTGTPIPAYDGPTVYIADYARGIGDGSSADNAMGNDPNYREALELGYGGFAADPRYQKESARSETPSPNISRYRGSALYKAVDALRMTGGMIVICGEVTVSFGDEAGDTTNFNLPAHSKNVIITSKNGSEDYTATASLNFNNNGQNLIFRTNGPTAFDGLIIRRTYDYSVKTLYLCASGKKLVIGEDVSMVRNPVYDDPADRTTSVFPILVGGNLCGSLKKNAEGVSVDMTILGGEYYRVQCTNEYPDEIGEIKGDVNVTLGGSAVVYNNFQVACVRDVSAANPGNIMGDVNITFDGADIRGSIYLTGAVATSYETKSCGAVKGNINVSVAGTSKLTELYLGYGCFLNNYDPDHPENGGKCTVSFFGSDWEIKPKYHMIFWGGVASNSPVGYNYSVLDFSGMTYDEFHSKRIMISGGAEERSLGSVYPLHSSSVNGSGTKSFSVGVYEAILPALWIADKPADPANPGDGSGSDAQNPIYNSDAYNASLGTGTIPSAELFRESALVQAVKQISSSGKGGVIKFAGDVTLTYGDSISSVSDFYLQGGIDLDFQKKITFDGCGHTLTFDAPSVVSGFRIMVNCPSEWNNMTVAVNYRSTSPLSAVTLYNNGYGVCWCFNGFHTVIGDNVTTTTNVAGNFGYPILIAGRTWGSVAFSTGDRGLNIGEAVNLTVGSGTWTNIHLTGQFPNGANANTNGTVTVTLKDTAVLNCIYGCATRGMTYGQGIKANNAGGILDDVSLTLDNTTVANLMMTTPWGSASLEPAKDFAMIRGNVDLVLKNGAVLTGICYFTPTAAADSWSSDYTYGMIDGNVTVTVDGRGTGDPVRFQRFDLGGRGLLGNLVETNEEGPDHYEGDKSVFTLKFLGDNWEMTSAAGTPSIAFMGSGSNFYGHSRNAVVDFSGMTFEQFLNKKIGTKNVALSEGFYHNGDDADFTVNGIVYGKKAPDETPFGFNEVVYPQGGIVVDGSTLTAETDLTLKVLVRTNLDLADLSMTVTDDKGVSETIPGTVSGRYVVFPVTGINAQRMGDGFDLVVYNGENVIFEKTGFTVREFALNAYHSSADSLGIEQSKYESLLALLASTLNYGAEAQRYAKYRLASLVNEGEDIADLMTYAVSADSETFANAKNVGASSETDTRFSAATVYLANSVDFVIKFLTDNTKNLSFLIMDGDTVVANLPVEDMTADPDGRFSVIPGLKIKATELGKVFTFKLVRNFVRVQNLEYSIGSYLTNMANSSTVGALVNSLTNYGVAAMAYAEA